MKFWAASGKADNCKTSLPNFHSQLHCSHYRYDKTHQTHRGVCEHTCENGSTTFSPSQGNLAAWGDRRTRNRCSWCCQEYQCCRTLSFPTWEPDSGMTSARKPYELSLLMVLPAMERAARGPKPCIHTIPIAHRRVWVERDLKDRLVQPLRHGQGHLPLD